MDRKVIVYVTKKDSGQCLEKQETAGFRQDIQQQENKLLIVYPEETFQSILGFGGAVTEAVGYTWQRLGEKNKRKVLEAYFGKDGIGYNFCRTPIQSCDFAMENYSYVKEGDQSLESFTTKRDEKYIIPFIEEAVKLSSEDLLLFSSPWSPPGWMKESGKMNGGGKLKRECYGLWAEMLARFMADYRDRGFPLWGISVQNESKADQKWESCIFTPEEELIFIRDYLYPAAKELCRLPSGHIEGFYEAFGNLYHGFCVNLIVKKTGGDPGTFRYPTVEDGVRGLEFVDACLESNAKDNIWVTVGQG